MKIINESETQIQNKNKRRQKRARVERRYSERVRAK